MTQHAVLAATRIEGVADLNEVEAVLPETDWEFSVVRVGEVRRDSTTLRGVPGAGRAGGAEGGTARRAD